MHKNTECLDFEFAILYFVVELFYIPSIQTDHPLINGASFSINLN